MEKKTLLPMMVRLAHEAGHTHIKGFYENNKGSQILIDYEKGTLPDIENLTEQFQHSNLFDQKTNTYGSSNHHKRS